MLPLNKKPYRVFSLWLRIFHWTMVLCVTALFWTGLYIGNPGFQATPGSVEPTIAVGGWFSMEMIRKIHFIAAFILIASFIFRIYGGIRYRGDRLFPRFHMGYHKTLYDVTATAGASFLAELLGAHQLCRCLCDDVLGNIYRPCYVCTGVSRYLGGANF